MSPPITVTVVAACYNEAEVIDQFHSEVSAVLRSMPHVRGRLVVIDDGSTDGTLNRLNLLAMQDDCLDVYSLSRNFGHQVALTAGLEAANGDAVILMDADLQHPPSLIPELVARWRQGYDVVSTIREDAAGLSAGKRWSSRVFYWLINQLSDTAVVPGAADFCLLSERARRALCAMPERHRFLRGMVSWIGFPRAFVRFAAPPRAAGATKYTPWRMTQLALDAVLSFSTRPMRLATRTGAALLIPGVLYAVWVLLRYIAGGRFEPGWSSLIGAMMVIGGAQLVFIGLVGEYLARIFEESKARPLYFFKQTPADRLPRAAPRD